MIVNEIKEIMNGNIKIFNMRIEGETIGFDTPYNSNWNFMPQDFEQIIDTLQQENTQLKENNMSMQEEMARTWGKADLYKEVIEEVKDRITIKLGRYINEKDYVIDDVALDELLQILDKVKGDSNE